MPKAVYDTRFFIETSLVLGGTCVTDDPHFDKVEDLSTRWI